MSILVCISAYKYYVYICLNAYRFLTEGLYLFSLRYFRQSVISLTAMIRSKPESELMFYILVYIYRRSYIYAIG